VSAAAGVHGAAGAGRRVGGIAVRDTRLDPRNGYAASKVAQEHLAAAWARDTGGVVAALRHHFYGLTMLDWKVAGRAYAQTMIATAQRLAAELLALDIPIFAADRGCTE
jgi:nucleoside-diphosphate-sugar epimerase